MSKTIKVVFVIILLLFVGWYLFEKNIGVINVPGRASVENTLSQGSPRESLAGFTLPPGFGLNIFASGLPGARVIEMDPKGRVLVSQTSEGEIVALIDANFDNIAEGSKVLASGLKKPHGMAMNCEAEDKCYLYVAESDKLSRYLYDADAPALGAPEKLMDIAASLTDRHFTRSLVFLPYPEQATLLVSVGSTCDVCEEKDSDHASVLSYNIKTGVKAIYAKGLRNATFMTLSPADGRVYATEMGRDGLGDDLPPDEINIINKDKNYGWPVCYGQNIHDTKFDKKTYIRNPCMAPFETASFVDLPAHSAPLGLAFIPEEGWAEEYWYNLLVAYHGSWNRSTPTGYKIARIKMNAKGEYLGIEDFITGWLDKDGKKTGRPVDIKVFPGGTAYITDDSAGVVYRLFRN